MNQTLEMQEVADARIANLTGMKGAAARLSRVNGKLRFSTGPMKRSIVSLTPGVVKSPSPVEPPDGVSRSECRCSLQRQDGNALFWLDRNPATLHRSQTPYSPSSKIVEYSRLSQSGEIL